MVGSRSSFSNCIVIGKGLSAKYNNHLLIDSNGIKIDRVMNQNEQSLIADIIKAIEGLPGLVFNSASSND